MTNWIKVSERLPEEVGTYIGFAKVKGGTIKTLFYFDWTEFQFVVPEVLPTGTFQVTHWLQLPEDPES
jgi:hypothetical protein